MNTFQNILIGVTGSIAAYTIPALVRSLRTNGMSVRVVLTESAEHFVAPMCLEVLSENVVYKSTDHLTTASKMNHIELARWADLILIAPASAHFMAQLAHGLCNDLLSTLCLASEAPIWVAPAMNRIMWMAMATQANASILKTRGIKILGPDHGPQICGEMGEGRMLPVEALIDAIYTFQPSVAWAHKKVVITGGPTREAIDPVRYISNHSTGKMAYELANLAKNKGASVTLITGPTNLPIPAGVKGVAVNTSAEMLETALKESAGADVFIGAAAVVDYKPKNVANQKIKKCENSWRLDFEENSDIIATVAQSVNRPKYVIGFAAETQNLEKNAQDKLHNKRLDAIVANPVGVGIGFGDVLHEAVFLSRSQAPIIIPKSTKTVVAEAILKAVESLFV